MLAKLLSNMRATLLALLVLAAVTGAALPGAAANVAVIVSADVDAYHKALRGFRGTLNHRIVAEYDMEGDFDQGRRILREILSDVHPDLIVAVGIWALQIIVRERIELPVVYAMVLNPPSIAGAGVTNITGASMNVPVEQPLRVLRQLGPQIRRVGVIFNRAKTGYLVTQAEAVAREEGIQLVTKEIRSVKEAVQAVNSLQRERIDALWILPDETILDPKVFKYTLLFSYRNKVPVFGLSERQVRMGAVIALSFASSEDIGRQAAELANGILGGKSPAELPYTTARQVKLTVSLKAARKLGMEIPESIIARANTVIR